MKKKGLIISTVVMAVVLIASLTTATYAWFSSSASTVVDSMTISVNAASDIVIGVAKDGNAKKNAGTTSALDNDYMNGSITMDGQYAKDGTNSLGTQLTVGFGSSSEIKLDSAVATSSDSGFAKLTTNAGKNVFNPSGNYIFFAESSENASGENKTQSKLDETYNVSDAKSATANKQYIYLPMGARAAKDKTYGIECEISITIKDVAENFKDNAALHLYIVNDGKVQDIDVFGNYKATDTKSKVELTDYTISAGDLVKKVEYTRPTEGFTATLSFVIIQDTNELSTTSAQAINFFEIYAFVYGPDSDCTSAGTGTSVAFNMQFYGLTDKGARKTA